MSPLRNTKSTNVLWESTTVRNRHREGRWWCQPTQSLQCLLLCRCCTRSHENKALEITGL